MATFLAGKGSPLGHGVKLRHNAASRATDLSTPILDLHDGRETGRIIGVLRLELFEGVFHGDPHLL